jgi:hypothetical protein
MLNNILAASEAGVLLHTCLRLLPSATAVLKFILGRSLHPENYTHEPNRCSTMLPKVNTSLEGTGIRKIG